MKELIIPFLVILCIFISSVSSIAADVTGSDPLICSTFEIYENDRGAKCQQVTAQSINLPQFLRIDFKKKTIKGTRADGEVMIAKIESIKRLEGKLILSGIQNGRAWNIIIQKEKGELTLTVADDDVGFVAFGACTTP